MAFVQRKMKKWTGGVIISSLCALLVLRYGILEAPLARRTLQGPLPHNASDPLQLLNTGNSPAVQNPENGSQVVSTVTLISSLFASRNLSDVQGQSLETWKHMGYLMSHPEGLPYASEAVREAAAAWESLMFSVEAGKQTAFGNASSAQKMSGKQCPYSITMMNRSEFAQSEFKLKIPCGLVQGSSITVIGTPVGLLGDFRIDLTATALPGEPDPPIVLHYNVRLNGDKLTEDPVIVQNTWTSTNDWGAEERCPSPDPDNKKVDDLDNCSSMVIKDDSPKSLPSGNPSASILSPAANDNTNRRHYFPFKQGHLAVTIFRVGLEGFQITVDGKHITSFAYRDSLEPWLVNEARISGDIKLISVLAGGLPTSEEIEHGSIKMLKSVPISKHKAIDLFIGIFSTANNFKRRMAVRRTWMQYDAVRSGAVVVRFFVGLHKNQMVNEELWNEAQTYGDVQLMPFVDYYSLITWKTIAICIYGINVVSAKYIMKTDDDSFVRVDEVLSSLESLNMTHGLLYGRINSDSHPHRHVDSKWYISPEEWPDDMYPPWAHGPGYVVSRDIAVKVYKQHVKGHLKMFKLEDVAMGIWIDDMKKKGLEVKYANEERVYNIGCTDGYIVAHYQEPRELLCLWENIQQTHHADCCRQK